MIEGYSHLYHTFASHICQTSALWNNRIKYIQVAQSGNVKLPNTNPEIKFF